jgi:hypothetical protein
LSFLFVSLVSNHIHREAVNLRFAFGATLELLELKSEMRATNPRGIRSTLAAETSSPRRGSSPDAARIAAQDVAAVADEINGSEQVVEAKRPSSPAAEFVVNRAGRD